MGDVLAVLGVLLLVMVTMTFALVFTVRWRLRRLNRVHPDHRSPAPLGWLVSPATPARLHRRLRKALLLARFAVRRRTDPPAYLTSLLADLEREGLALDDALVATALQPTFARAQLLPVLAARVRAIEVLATRLAAAAPPPAVPGVGPSGFAGELEAGGRDPLEDLDERLRALEAAQHEVSRLR